MIFDCFFSYQHDDLDLVQSIVYQLEQWGLHCWYAPRNVKGRYAKAIADGISHSKVFILILNSRSAVSEAVLNEVEIAQNVSKSGAYAVIQPVCTEAFDFDAPEYQEVMYYIRRRHFIDADGITDATVIAQNIINSQPTLLKGLQQRTESAYVVQPKEDVRLALQNELLNLFDNDVYASVLGQYENLSVLDIGCGTGDMLISKLQRYAISTYVGVDRSARQIAAATAKYKDPRFRFYELDAESETFEVQMTRLMQQNGVGQFDVINISMVLLHMNDPIKMLSIAYKCLSEDGVLIIRDIDDGLNYAFPDDTRDFERIVKMCDHDQQSGNRRNGRQIYYQLRKAGFTEITLERQGFSSIGMNDAQKETMFQLYFPFTLENAKIMSEKFPKNPEYREDYLWYHSCFEDIHKRFMNSDFVFSFGFVSYTARK